MSITLISTVTVGAGGAASIDFTSIPGTYTDLMLVTSFRSVNASGGAHTVLSINGSTSTFTWRQLYGTGASAGSDNGATSRAGIYDGSGDTASTYANAQIYLPNYAGSTNKSFSVDSVTENNGSTAFQSLLAGLWSTTSAITSLSLAPTSGNWTQYSSASLYGITKGSSNGVTVA